MLMACVRIGNVVVGGSAGGSRFPIKAAADEALGVEVAVMMTSSAAGVVVGVMEAGAGVTGVEPAAVTATVGAGERVIVVGEVVALGSSVGVRDTVAAGLGVSVGASVDNSTGVGIAVAGMSGKGVFVGNTSTRGGLVGGSPMGVCPCPTAIYAVGGPLGVVGDCAWTPT
jgi:hypothetical protein